MNKIICILAVVLLFSGCAKYQSKDIDRLQQENKELKEKLAAMEAEKDPPPPPGNSIDLTHLYEPHIAIRHSSNNDRKHYYSVLMVVPKGTPIYEGIRASDINERKYDRAFAFKQMPNPWKEVETDRYSISADYELAIAEYKINLNDPKNSQFIAVVDTMHLPIKHPNHHTKGDKAFVHDGTIHKPDN